jgi:ABC-type dipeptide/oligopeptide/nickel transport system permease component
LGVLRFVAKRAVLVVPVLIGVTLLTFLVSHVVVADPARAWAGIKASPQTVDAIRQRYHLNAPLILQFAYYLTQLVSGDLGVSPVTGHSVLADILTYFPATIELAVTAILLVIAFGVPLGVMAAVNKDKTTDHVLRMFSLAGVSSPPFLAALALQLVGFYYLRIFPLSGRIAPELAVPPRITGFLTVDSLLAGDLLAFGSTLLHLVLPALTLAFLSWGFIVRLLRSSMLDVLNNDYVRTARAKGLKERVVIYKHALLNALIPTTTVIGYMFAFMLGGSVVVEYIFSWPGIGRYAANAIINLDFPAIMGTTVIYTLTVLLINFLVDIAYAVLDPRIRY